ncbi:MAG: type VI secretion protein IcmF/TssM N-terminal domain-containing protein [Isosphaeraceae bacterium]
MNHVTAPIWQWVFGVLAALVALVVGMFAIPKLWGRIVRLRWWFAGLSVLVLAWVFLVVLPGRYPPERFEGSALPSFFRQGYWAWMYLFLLGIAGSALALWRTLRTTTTAEPVMDEAEAGVGGSDLEAAWAEIRVRLDQARIDLAHQKVYLFLAPDEERAAALIESAGLQIFVQAPEGPAPIHAYATSDGILLSCSGTSVFGSGNDAAAVKLANLCDKLLAMQPDCPIVRGVAVLFPIDWAAQPESTRLAAAVRDDLQTIQRTLKVRPPVFALFPGMEGVPGFTEFIARITAQVSPQMRDNRVGFAVPATHPFSGDLVQRGMTWMSGWFHNWTLNLLAGDLLNQEGNSQLISLDSEFRRYRKRLRSILESALSTHRESQPVLFRGCYFMATGDGRAEQAFTAGLLRGARSRILADQVATTWTVEAEREDRRYARIALGIGLIGGLLILLAWFSIAMRTGLGWLGLLGVVIAWIVVFLRLNRRS